MSELTKKSNSRFLKEIGKYLKDNNEEGYVFLINNNYLVEEPMELVVDSVNTQRKVFNFSLKETGNVPNVYISNLKENKLYRKIYSKTP